MIGLRKQKGQDQRMEEHRCRVAATAVDDLRCRGSFDSTLIVDEDPRYACIDRRMDLEVEDSRCSSVAMKMEDPRCQGLSLKW